MDVYTDRVGSDATRCALLSLTLPSYTHSFPQSKCHINVAMVCLISHCALVCCFDIPNIMHVITQHPALTRNVVITTAFRMFPTSYARPANATFIPEHTTFAFYLFIYITLPFHARHAQCTLRLFNAKHVCTFVLAAYVGSILCMFHSSRLQLSYSSMLDLLFPTCLDTRHLMHSSR